MQSQCLVQCTIAGKLLMLAGLMLAPTMLPGSCYAQLTDTNFPTPIRTAHGFEQDYICDKPFQYSPCDPFERGKIYRLHIGHWGRYYNCDGEEEKRCSPYIYWKMNDKPTLPGHLGPLDAICCEYNQVRQRILDGSCAECQNCGRTGCPGCAGQATGKCSTCNRADCDGCGANTSCQQNNVSCANGSCGNCLECKLRKNESQGLSAATSSCATGDCGNCRACSMASEIPNAGSLVESGCASGNCGSCAECSRRGRVQPAVVQTSSACASGNCGKCRACKSGGLFARNCANVACAPDGFRGPRTACAREGSCGCVDTTFDAMAPAGLIYYRPDPGVVPESAPSQDPIMQPVPAVEPLSGSPINVAPQGNKVCGCVECRLARARQEQERQQAQQRDARRR